MEFSLKTLSLAWPSSRWSLVCIIFQLNSVFECVRTERSYRVSCGYASNVNKVREIEKWAKKPSELCDLPTAEKTDRQTVGRCSSCCYTSLHQAASQHQSKPCHIRPIPRPQCSLPSRGPTLQYDAAYSNNNPIKCRLDKLRSIENLRETERTTTHILYALDCVAAGDLGRATTQTTPRCKPTTTTTTTTTTITTHSTPQSILM